MLMAKQNSPFEVRIPLLQLVLETYFLVAVPVKHMSLRSSMLTILEDIVHEFETITLLATKEAAATENKTISNVIPEEEEQEQAHVLSEVTTSSPEETKAGASLSTGINRQNNEKGQQKRSLYGCSCRFHRLLTACDGERVLKACESCKRLSYFLDVSVPFLVEYFDQHFVEKFLELPVDSIGMMPFRRAVFNLSSSLPDLVALLLETVDTGVGGAIASKADKGAVRRTGWIRGHRRGASSEDDASGRKWRIWRKRLKGVRDLLDIVTITVKLISKRTNAVNVQEEVRPSERKGKI